MKCLIVEFVTYSYLSQDATKSHSKADFFSTTLGKLAVEFSIGPQMMCCNPTNKCMHTNMIKTGKVLNINMQTL